MNRNVFIGLLIVGSLALPSAPVSPGGPVFGEKVKAKRCSGTGCMEFYWTTTVRHAYVIGAFTTSSDVSTYPIVAFNAGLNGTSFTHTTLPTVDSGFYYLVRPDNLITGGSWQSSPGAEPQRDVILP